MLFRSQKRMDLTSISNAGYRLLGLINNLLELSKLEAGKVEVAAEEFELADFFDNLVSRSRQSILESGSVLHVRPAPTGRIVCDVLKLQRVVEGLVSNAVKFTRNGHVTLSASIREDSWTFSIEDTGIGIAPAQITNIFETFGMSDDETASKYVDEVKLGLPLAYRYCLLMGGKLSIQSELGHGATVTVVMPRRPSAVARQADALLEPQWQAA